MRVKKKWRVKMSKFLENLTPIDLNSEERPGDVAALQLRVASP